MATVTATDYLVLPDGCEPDDSDALTFGLVVHYCGTFRGRRGGGWGIFRGSPGGYSLSRAGRTWEYPPRFRRWQFRWESLEEALAVAQEHADTGTVHGRTYAQWAQQRTPRTAADD